MELNRRKILQAIITSIGIQIQESSAQPSWPERPVKFIVPFAPGGGADIATRMLGEQLRSLWGGNNVIIENKPGGNTIIAANSLLSGPRDGYTFLATIDQTTQLPYLGQKLNFDPAIDLIMIGPITLEQLVLVVNTNSGIRSLAELIEFQKNNPKGLSYGTFGVGSTGHVVAAQMAKVLNWQLLIAHYRGAAPAVQAVLSGEVTMALSNLGTVQQHISNGKLRALAVTGPRRYRFIPEVPNFTELGIPELEFLSAIRLYAPKGTSLEIIKKMKTDLNKALSTPELVAKINGFYQETGNSIPDSEEMVKRDNEMNKKLIQAHQIRID